MEDRIYTGLMSRPMGWEWRISITQRKLIEVASHIATFLNEAEKEQKVPDNVNEKLTLSRKFHI
jgi:hypothetical protein